MKYALTIILGFAINQAIGQDRIESQISAIDELSGLGKYETEQFFGFVQPCETIWYFNNSDLLRIHKGCGDVSMHMFSVDYYFVDSYVIMRNIDVYYNAPPTFTEEVAKAEGVTSGWYDSSKTVTDTLIHYVKNGQLIHAAMNDSVINYSNERSREITDEILDKVEFLRTRQCRYIFDEETNREIYVNASNQLDVPDFCKKLMQKYVYPDNQEEIQTRFIIEFTVEPDGRASHISINAKQQDLTPAERGFYDLISSMTDFEIADCYGYKVPVRYTFPIMIEIR